MEDCWKILGIYHTNDFELIKKTYRDLLKKYHPDTVHTEQEKMAYTIKCAQINSAYKEALRQAKSGQFSVAQDGYGPPPVPEDPWYRKVFFVLITLFILFLGFLWTIYTIL